MILRRVVPVMRAENCGAGVNLNMPFHSYLHILLSEKLKHFAVFLALPQPLRRIQIRVGGCLVSLFITSLSAAPPRSQEGRKRQSVAVFPAIQLLSSLHDLDQEGIGKEGEHRCRRAKQTLLPGSHVLLHRLQEKEGRNKPCSP